MALQTMYQAKSNSPQTTLTAIIAADATTLSVFDGSVLPPAPNMLTLGTDENAEVVYYSTLSGNVVSGLVRGYSGTTASYCCFSSHSFTTASVWEEGTQVSREFTSYDHDTFITNINALQSDVSGLQTTVTGKLSKYATDATQWDTTPTASSTKPVTSGGIKTYADNKILYFYQQSTSTTSAATSEFCNVSDSRITADTVVLNCEFTVPSAITSGVSWTTAAGYISLKGICTSSTCKVNLVLGQKGN